MSENKVAGGHVPAWVDKRRLGQEVCLSETGIDDWIKKGLLPAGRLRGRKLIWEWREVNAWLKHGGDPGQTVEVEDADVIELVRRRTERVLHGEHS